MSSLQDRKDYKDAVYQLIEKLIDEEIDLSLFKQMVAYYKGFYNQN